MMTYRDITRAALAACYDDPYVDLRDRFPAEATYHGSLTDYHGRAVVLGDCSCPDGCAVLAAEDSMHPDRRIVAAVPCCGLVGCEHVQILLHARGSSFTIGEAIK